MTKTKTKEEGKVLIWLKDLFGVESLAQFFWNCILAGCATAVTFAFGGWDLLLGTLLAFVVIDYLTGVYAAAHEGKLSSDVGIKGIAKKVFIFVIVMVANLVDKALAIEMIKPATIYFYMANEVLSIVENGGRIGLPIPPIITEAIALLKGKSKKDIPQDLEEVREKFYETEDD